MKFYKRYNYICSFAIACALRLQYFPQELLSFNLSEKLLFIEVMLRNFIDSVSFLPLVRPYVLKTQLLHPSVLVECVHGLIIFVFGFVQLRNKPFQFLPLKYSTRFAKIVFLHCASWPRRCLPVLGYGISGNIRVLLYQEFSQTHDPN